MAIKTFTTGEVLTAANTNTYLNNGGLVYVSESTFSAQTQVDFANVFTSDYSDYRIEFQQLTTTIAGEPILRLRDSGGVISTSNYLIQRLEVTGASVNGIASGAVSGFFPTYVAASATAAAGISGFLDVFQPQTTGTYTRIAGQICRTDSTTGLYSVTSTGIFNLTTVITGFSLLRISTGTLSGTVRIYGYRKA